MAPPKNCLLAVYADESCLGNGREGSNPGGAGGLIELAHPKSGELVRRDFWLAEKATTNNRMALRSAIEALDIASSKKWNCVVVFTTDSRYLVDGMTSWVHDWARRGWKRKGGEIGNLELWQELVDVAASHRVEWRWVKGHNGHPQNEYANMLATRAAAQQNESKGAVDSGFDAWMASERAKGRMSLDPSPLPEMRSFREARSLPRGETDSLF